MALSWICHKKFGPGAKFGPRSKLCNEKAAKLIPSWTQGSVKIDLKTFFI